MLYILFLFTSTGALVSSKTCLLTEIYYLIFILVLFIFIFTSTGALVSSTTGAASATGVSVKIIKKIKNKQN